MTDNPDEPNPPTAWDLANPDKGDGIVRNRRAPDTQVAPSPPPRQATVCAPQCSVWPDCACGRATATCERCDDTGCPECDPEWAKHQVPASPQVAPDSLVARARAAAKHAQNGPFLRELAEGLEQLQRERDQAHDAVQRLTNGEPYDRILTAHAIANGIEMYMRRADVAESRLERVTQAAAALVAKLDVCEDVIAGMVLRCYGMTGYNGPQYGEELKAVRDAIRAETTEAPTPDHTTASK